jgi:outer membrane protein assembly factor BamB
MSPQFLKRWCSMAEHPSSQQIRMLARILAAVSLSFLGPILLIPVVRLQAAAAQHLLYVASPGIRNYVEYGGVGILVFDIYNGYTFVRRIPTWDVPEGKKPENVKGIAASAKTGRVYVTSLKRMIAINAVTGKKIWDKTYKGGCDRMAISPDGKYLYVPTTRGSGMARCECGYRRCDYND